MFKENFLTYSLKLLYSYEKDMIPLALFLFVRNTDLSTAVKGSIIFYERSVMFE